ncbi:hypothetical protein HNY73_009154 [Argiope bruennichi]|uniref:Uncharacterized protein n=1 Tax=Argiope bruennichi TaxID=94029 RepID=A0A8T0FB39_ARGBR|nr:hypothetical protein HNY73_009154 [Argiope bruennichi]
MRPGSFVLYIDNAGGGFHQLVRQEAHDCNLITVFGPLKHELYVNHNFNTKRFGYTPCLETKVTVHIWRKTSRNMNIELELNDPSTYSAFPASHNVNVQVQRPATVNSRSNYSNQRGYYNRPNASSQSVYAHGERVINSQSYLPEAGTNRNFNTRSTGSQPWSTTSTWPEAGRNQDADRLVENEDEQENDCGTCCVIS